MMCFGFAFLVAMALCLIVGFVKHEPELFHAAQAILVAYLATGLLAILTWWSQWRTKLF